MFTFKLGDYSERSLYQGFRKGFQEDSNRLISNLNRISQHDKNRPAK